MGGLAVIGCLMMIIAWPISYKMVSKLMLMLMARKSGGKPQGLAAPGFALAFFLSFIVAVAIVSAIDCLAWSCHWYFGWIIVPW